jgi:NADPH:quinone reductase-like Zn-dependent oxidoreductase
MRAIVIDEYGGNDKLQNVELPDPKVGPDFVLVRVKAVGVNPVDWKSLRGYLDSGFPTHFPMVPCWDAAGIVERVGPAVTDIEVGDEVIAYNRQDHVQYGTLAELTAVPRRGVALKPRHATWEEAAALPLAGLTAYQTLFRGLDVTARDTVMIHAASGGVGSFAVQLAVHAGARVIGSASERNHDYVRGMGAEPVRYGNHMVEDVQRLAPDGVDAVLDLVGGEALSESPAILAPGGRIASIVDARLVAMLGGRYCFVYPDPDDLAELSRMVDAKELHVELQEVFSFDRAVEAFDRVEAGHVRGKVVVRVDSAPS